MSQPARESAAEGIRGPADHRLPIDAEQKHRNRKREQHAGVHGGHRHRAVVERFTRELAPLVTSGPPGVTGYTTGRPPVREVLAYWPALIAKSAVTPRVEMLP